MMASSDVARPRNEDRRAAGCIMSIDPDRRMSPDEIRAGARRVAWATPVLFLVMFFVILYQGHSAGAAFLVGLATAVAPWILIAPILLWGGRSLEGLGIVAALLRIFRD
jgi:hypothetical protein